MNHTNDQRVLLANSYLFNFRGREIYEGVYKDVKPLIKNYALKHNFQKINGIVIFKD